jgi:2-dehydropantoate 2-reductase
MSKTPCEGPVLGSIEHGEASEIDYQNGEMVKIAEVLGFPTPLNSLMVELVHELENTNRFISKKHFLYKVADRLKI